jgi:hypothetical protein
VYGMFIAFSRHLALSSALHNSLYFAHRDMLTKMRMSQRGLILLVSASPTVSI